MREHTGLFLHTGEGARRLPTPVGLEKLEVRAGHVAWAWTDPDAGLAIEACCRRLDGQAALLVHRFRATRPLRAPHLSWGLSLNIGGRLDHYHWVHSPTQMGYSFGGQSLTLWLLSARDPGRPVTRFAGCQALVSQCPDPASLEFQLLCGYPM